MDNYQPEVQRHGLCLVEKVLTKNHYLLGSPDLLYYDAVKLVLFSFTRNEHVYPSNSVQKDFVLVMCPVIFWLA